MSVDLGQFVIVVYRLLKQYVTVVLSVYYDVPGNLVTFSKVGVGAKPWRQLLGQFFYQKK